MGCRLVMMIMIGYDIELIIIIITNLRPISPLCYLPDSCNSCLKNKRSIFHIALHVEKYKQPKLLVYRGL